MTKTRDKVTQVCLEGIQLTFEKKIAASEPLRDTEIIAYALTTMLLEAKE